MGNYQILYPNFSLPSVEFFSLSSVTKNITFECFSYYVYGFFIFHPRH